ncbi:MAG: hypothetical protein WDO15_27215 [Bacteroidota bacterium]
MSTLIIPDPTGFVKKHSEGLFKVGDPNLIGKPENDPAVMVEFTYTVDNQDIVVRTPLVYKWTDPCERESSHAHSRSYPPSQSRYRRRYICSGIHHHNKFVLLAKSSSNSEVGGTLTLTLPKGWKSEPALQPFKLVKRGEEQKVSFTVTPSKEEMTGKLNAIATVNGKNV